MLQNYIAVDLETTGLNPKENRIIEIGAIKVKDGTVQEIFETFVNPGCAIPERITEVTGIDGTMVADAPYIEKIMENFIEFSENLPLLGHNLIFDYSFLKANAVNLKLNFERKGIDTLKIARAKLTEVPSKKLDYLCGHFGIKDDNHHRAVNDAQAANELYKILCEKFENENEVFQPTELIYNAKRQSPITEKQVKYLNDLIKYHNLSADYDPKKLTKNQASRIIDRIILEHGRIF